MWERLSTEKKTSIYIRRIKRRLLLSQRALDRNDRLRGCHLGKKSAGAVDLVVMTD
jgi:hypothetical protein